MHDVFLAPITAAAHREYDCCSAILEEAPPAAVYKYVDEIGRTLHKKSVGIAALLTHIYNHDFHDSNLQNERQSIAHAVHELMPAQMYQKVELWIDQFEKYEERYRQVFDQDCDRTETARGARFLASLKKAPWVNSFREHLNQLALARNLKFWSQLSYQVMKDGLIEWMTHNRGYESQTSTQREMRALSHTVNNLKKQISKKNRKEPTANRVHSINAGTKKGSVIEPGRNLPKKSSRFNPPWDKKKGCPRCGQSTRCKGTCWLCGDCSHSQKEHMDYKGTLKALPARVPDHTETAP